jgi:hypothetical protein
VKAAVKSSIRENVCLYFMLWTSSLPSFMILRWVRHREDLNPRFGLIIMEVILRLLDNKKILTLFSNPTFWR